MVEGFHEYFKMKEEMDKVVQEQESIIEKAQTEQSNRDEERQQEGDNRMMPSQMARPSMGNPMPSESEAPMGGMMPQRPESSMEEPMSPRPEPQMGRPMPPRPEPSMGGSRPPRPSRPGNRPRCSAVHVIKEGDTLYKISRMHNVKVIDLLLANPYVNVYNLQIGDEICVPIKPVPFVDNHVPYIIRENDTLGSVLEKTDLTFEELAEYNPFVKEMSLPANNVIFLPGKEEY